MRMEVITRTERRRLYSDAEKARLMAECDAPGSSVIKVAKQHDMATSVLHRWRHERKKAQVAASTPMQFVAFGDIDAIAPDLACDVARLSPQLRGETAPAINSALQRRDLSIAIPPNEAPLLPHLGSAPGTIAITLGSGARVSVDSYVNEKALARVLRTLKAVA